ncbi:hypothetical protein GUITHDRAFT_151480 [Guillardia theta CCMP2712]|uniref:Uncharacterized protein n=2 Tax=Guillardia theta TaxID=55529 RepID=L1JL40_GUITC|nr:hypothetical protein GUITHDRAFT_151480 [Guillardia theta CCMP2712]EKX49236.1 hypothetical protein GUITHDRAFT_151480 [Guillardia theta CCMP2712]|eukprot:XP_005836216.1 hypothetical protein GUITHDRAFT_151480 [Guillardia theta CCMP2712]
MPAHLKVFAFLLLVCHAGCSAPLPNEGLKQPSMEEIFDENRNARPEFSEMMGSTGHPLRFLPVNSSRARFYTCPYAFIAAGPGLGMGKDRQALRAARVCGLKMKENHGKASESTRPTSRRAILGCGLALLLAGGRDALALPDQTLLQGRPTELRDKESCFMWNGEKKCTSCVKACEEYKKTFKNLDCTKQCTVEYGSAKPTDEESISFNDFVDRVNAGSITRVDFYGPNGDKAYAVLSSGQSIRIGEGFPIEVGNEQSSPLQVARLLAQKQIPYKFHFLDNFKYQRQGSF